MASGEREMAARAAADADRFAVGVAGRARSRRVYRALLA